MPKNYEMVGLTASEYEIVVNDLGREPSELELAMYGVLWSEHCSYKHSKKLLRNFPTTGERVVQGPGENAGILDGGDGLGIVFKIESHNHPSAVEPYQGAATGVGGIVRDIFSMGARPVALLNSLRFGKLHKPRNRFLMSGVVSGVAGYGNCLGIPDIGGEVYFDDCYDENPLVNAMCIGLIDLNKIKKGLAEGTGNIVMLVGATTGRDGILGASFASANLDEDSEEKRPSVQVGDPFMEKLLLEACMELVDNPYVVGVQDLGAAGITSSACEMAARSQSGLELHLDNVHFREEGMNALEIMLSESQERMLYVVKPEGVEDIKKVFDKWGLFASEIGKVTDTKLIEIYHQGELHASIPSLSIVDGVPLREPARTKPAYLDVLKNQVCPENEVEDNYGEIMRKMISHENIASRKWIYSQYDYMVQNNTVLRPGTGVGAVRIKGSKKAIGTTVDCNPLYPYLNPYQGGQMVVLESYRNLVAGGFTPIGISNCLNYPNPEYPENYYVLEQSVKGIADTCRDLNTPVTGGNVSLYNQGINTKIHPTPVIAMIGLTDNHEECITTPFKGEGHGLYVIGDLSDSLGGSAYEKIIHDCACGSLPNISMEKEIQLGQTILGLIKRGLLQSATDISQGGLAIHVLKGCIQGKVGAKLNITGDNIKNTLFAEGNGYLVSVAVEHMEQFDTLLEKENVTYKCIGNTGGDTITFSNAHGLLTELELEEVTDSWELALERMVNGESSSR